MAASNVDYCAIKWPKKRGQARAGRSIAKRELRRKERRLLQAELRTELRSGEETEKPRGANRSTALSALPSGVRVGIIYATGGAECTWIRELWLHNFEQERRWFAFRVESV